MMILNPKPVLKQIILKFYAVNLLLSSNTTFLQILFLVPFSSAKIKDCEAWLVSLACFWYKWWQIQFWFLFLGQQLGVGSWTQFTWICFLYWASSLDCVVAVLCLCQGFYIHANANSKRGGPVYEKMQLLEVFPDLAQEKLKSSQIKRKSSLIQSTHFKALVLQLISLCQGPSAKCSFWNSSEEGLGHLQRCSLESHGWRKVPSCPVGYLGAVVFSAVSLVDLTLSHTESVGSSCWWILNPLWDKQSGGFMAVQRLCWAIEHLTSFSMSRAPVSLPENCQGN